MSIKSPGEKPTLVMYCPNCDTQYIPPENCKCLELKAEHVIVGITEPVNKTHAQIKTAVAKRNEEEFRRTWNAAIEAAINKAKEVDCWSEQIEAIRRLKK